MILVTIGSLQPHKRILYSNGEYSFSLDTSQMMDTHLFLTNASGSEPIIKGGYTIGAYSPLRISGTLGLPYLDESYGFDKDAMERYNLKYYTYGAYQLSQQNENINLNLPIYIKVGKGGWLAMNNRGYWLTDEELAHSLFLITIQEIWNSEWIPYGWYWDNGGNFSTHNGLINFNGSIETEFIPSDIVVDKISLRVVAIARSADLKKGVIVENIMEYEFN
jgi:hypothetical protein